MLPEGLNPDNITFDFPQEFWDFIICELEMVIRITTLPPVEDNSVINIEVDCEFELSINGASGYTIIDNPFNFSAVQNVYNKRIIFPSGTNHQNLSVTMPNGVVLSPEFLSGGSEITFGNNQNLVFGNRRVDGGFVINIISTFNLSGMCGFTNSNNIYSSLNIEINCDLSLSINADFNYNIINTVHSTDYDLVRYTWFIELENTISASEISSKAINSSIQFHVADSNFL